MKQKTRIILISVAIAVVFTGIVILNAFAKKIPQNPAGTVGNTAGNLYNGGYFCEDSDGNVFFSNSFDNGSLYSMRADETNIKKLSSASVKSINTGGKYLYFYMSNSGASTGLGFVRRVTGVYRSDKKGRNLETLSRDPAGTLLLVDNHLYIQSLPSSGGVHFLKLGIDGKDATVLAKEKIYPASCVNGRIYYTSNKESLFLCQWDTHTDVSAVMVKYNMWNPIRYGDDIYFMDIHENYRLCRYNLSDETIEVLTSNRVDTFNVTSQYIYYQKSSDTQPGLMRMSPDGSEEVMIAEGIFNNINTTSRYVYFQEFGNTSTTYHVPHGSTEVTEFSGAYSAALTSE